MARSFYPWVENAPEEGEGAAEPVEAPEPAEPTVANEARIAVVDDRSSVPRVTIIDPAPVRDYLEEITQTTYSYAREQGGSIPFMVIREIVENLIHAYFREPVITIMPGGNTILFSDHGPGIAHKEQALEYGTTTATKAMKRYIRGVGSGLPYALQVLHDRGGSLTIEDNLTSGTLVTMTLEPAPAAPAAPMAAPAMAAPQPMQPLQPTMAQAPQPMQPAQAYPQVEAQPYPTAGAQPYPPLGGQPYPQLGAQPFPTPQAQPAPAYPQAGAAPQPGMDVTLDQADRQIIAYMAAHGCAGPTELSRAYGASLPTWSRHLASLESKGIVEKRGQKRFLTTAGEHFARLVAGV